VEERKASNGERAIGHAGQPIVDDSGVAETIVDCLRGYGLHEIARQLALYPD
jgi:hypothetical protein